MHRLVRLKPTIMDTPKYTKREEELLRENRDLRIKVKQMEQEILDQISHSGVWIEKLKAKSQQVIDLLNKYEPDPYESNAKDNRPD